jgi:hypothetical protein
MDCGGERKYEHNPRCLFCSLNFKQREREAAKPTRCVDCNVKILFLCRGRCPPCYARYRRKLNRHKQRTCTTCGLEFTTTRTDARFCSNACRQKAYRTSATASPAEGDRVPDVK